MYNNYNLHILHILYVTFIRIFAKNAPNSSKLMQAFLSVMEYSPRLPQDTKSLRSCSGNRYRHQTLKHLGQYWCYGNWSVIGNRGGRWSFWNWGDIGLFPASRVTTKTKKPSKHHTEMGSQNISRSLQKERKHTKRVSATIWVQV